MKIVGLMAENVKKLKLVNIRFEDGKPVITISGANEQGKSTFLDCFEYALSGAKSLKDVSMPIRKGEDHAKVVVETDEIIVTRTWTASGNTYLKVTNKDGWEPTGGAQALLDRLYSAFSFDPLSFSMMKDKDQLTTLLKMVKIPLDLDKWAIERKKVFDERTESNRQKSDLESQINGMVDSVLYVPDEETPVSAVLEEQAAAQAILNENNEKRRRHQEENSAAIATAATRRYVEHWKRQSRHRYLLRKSSTGGPMRLPTSKNSSLKGKRLYLTQRKNTIATRRCLRTQRTWYQN